MLRSIRLGLALAVVGLVIFAPQATASSGGWKFQPTINAPWVQGDDGQPLDSPILAAGLCRSSQFNTVNPYAATSNVDVIVGDPVNNSGFSNFGCRTPQNETTVAVNPTNFDNIIAGANDYRVCCDFQGLNDAMGGAYASFDGGAHWTNAIVPGLTAATGGQGNFKRVDAAGDPAMAFGPDGTAYYANLVFSRVSAASGIAVSVSHDGGVTWGQPNMVAYTEGVFLNDKEFITAGPDGRVVVTWTRFNLGPQQAGYRESPIVMAFSRDGGKTWNRQGTPVSDRAHPFDQGSMPQYAPDGTLYVAYEGASPASGFTQDATVIARSTDDGQTFTNTEVGRVYDDVDCYPTFGSQTLTGEHFRLNSYPSFSIDPTNGKLAIAWADDRGAGNCGSGSSSFVGTTNAKLVLVTSSNGTSFSAPQVISDGDVVFPGVAANMGKIAVSYYTRAYGAAHNPSLCNLVTGSGSATEGVPSTIDVCLDYAARTSSNNYGTETRLTTEGSNPYVEFANGSFIGDYSQIAFGSNGKAHPVWTDFRGNPNSGGTRANQDVYTTIYTP
ncbi:MAG: exo-alpha-sialidase [Actinobacteria bacterium]|nr:MAG: exo-alpha-sialidase [Actinomycetota bacterium]